jgi:hypothetical protein
LVLRRNAGHIAGDLKEKRNILCCRRLTTKSYKRILGVARENDSSITGHSQVVR